MPNETIISQVLLPLLEKYEYVDVPGLGRFSFIYIDAAVDETLHEAYPPIRSLKLETDVQGEHSVYDLLKGQKSEKSIKKLKSRINHSINELINLGCTVIPGFAKIKRSENRRIEIVDIDPAIRGFRQYLPAISLTPRDHTQVHMEQMEATPAFANEYSNNRNAKDSAVWQPYLLPLIFLAVSMIAIVLFWKSCVQSNLDADSTVLNKETSGKSVQPTPVDTSASIFSNENLVQYSDILTADLLKRGCTIVVGSFLDRNGAIQRASQVRSYGYDIDAIPAQPPYRVIIRFDCSRNDLKEYLSQVRNEVDVSSWYLEPEGYDPFD